MNAFKLKTTDNRAAISEQNSGRAAFFGSISGISQPNDVHEREADHMADKVMRMSDPSTNQTAFFKPANNHVQRKCQACEEEKKHVHRKESGNGEAQGSHELDSYVNSLGSSGKSMSQSSLQFFEQRFGHDFSNVRVHTDSVAAKSAQSINALAYTTGSNIVFNSGQYAPNSDTGKRLMAHELTHVIQQGGSAKTKIQKADKPAPACALVSAVPSAERFTFVVNTVNFNEGEEDRLKTKIGTIDAATPIDVLGMASAEGPEANNVSLSCNRAHKVADIIRGAGHTVGLENATGGYPGTANIGDYRSVALNYHTPNKPPPPPPACSATPLPAPAPGASGTPLLINPHIPSGSLCRGACGVNCPDTCTHEADQVICLPDSTGTCHFTYTYTGVLSCGSHAGCRTHDDCYDACEAAGDTLGFCHRGCDLDCKSHYDLSTCVGWAQGNGPFDMRLRFSNPPTVSAAIPGPCPP
ncbi:uncharacterized protein DUF4157 [Mucilaginibacter frigoritolerans]|uniref:Uncharacterized protein DUF4157 n=1 Tax=Mucilaginibacter frigoritolerans TaxID=652788 RepID=A0A562UAT8_9SPHI|nr:DUF4157 domain-containing protein [Mucilaginibacter frigoritolerans]TWJ02465.1 uncharacterized protein DUF4157 [Mucilaginibacter frigoritolerans]